MDRRSGARDVGVQGRSRVRLRAAGDADPAPVLVLGGEFDAVNVPEIDRFLRRRLGPFYQRQHLVLDLSAITFADSSFIGFLVRLVRELRAGGKELVLVRPAGQVRRLLAICGLPNLVPVFDSLDDALGCLKAGPMPLVPPRFELRRL
jgi:anti-sigma B factor antagonist